MIEFDKSIHRDSVMDEDLSAARGSSASNARVSSNGWPGLRPSMGSVGRGSTDMGLRGPAFKKSVDMRRRPMSTTTDFFVLQKDEKGEC